MNSQDLPRCAQLWTEQSRDLYNRLPIYMAEQQVKWMQYYSRWGKLLNTTPWEANMGFTMRGIGKRPSPIMTSQVLPNAMSALPKKNVNEVREVKEDTILYRQDFESNLMHFLPNFVDFLTDSVEFTNKDMVEKIAVYTDQFYRTAIFHGSPKVWVAGAVDPLKITNYWISPNISLAKSTAQLQALIAECNKTIDFVELSKLAVVMYSNEDIIHFSGSVLADGSDGSQLKGKYCLLTSTEVWSYLTQHDPYFKNNRPLAMNMVTDGVTGSLFGQWTTMFEKYELRIAADGTLPPPQTIEEGVNAYNYGEAVPNPAWVQAPYGVAFALGDEAYRAIKIGPPPKEWTGMTMKEFSRLDWNGKVEITKNVMVPCLDAGGATVLDTNKRGEYLQLIASLALGIAPTRRRNIIPIIYLRQVGGLAE